MSSWVNFTTFIPLHDTRDLLARMAQRYLLCSLPYFCLSYAMRAFGSSGWNVSLTSLFIMAVPFLGGLSDLRKLKQRARTDAQPA